MGGSSEDLPTPPPAAPQTTPPTEDAVAGSPAHSAAGDRTELPLAPVSMAAHFAEAPAPDVITAPPEVPLEGEILGAALAEDAALMRLHKTLEFAPVPRHLAVHAALMTALRTPSTEGSALPEEVLHILYEVFENLAHPLPWTLQTKSNASKSLPLDGPDEAPRERERQACRWILESVDFRSDSRLSRELMRLLDQSTFARNLISGAAGDSVGKTVLHLAAQPDDVGRSATALVNRHVTNNVAASAILKLAVGNEGQPGNVEAAYQRLCETLAAPEPNGATRASSSSKPGLSVASVLGVFARFARRNPPQ